MSSAFDSRGALRLSQQAPTFLQSQLASPATFPGSLFLTAERPELWSNCEQILLACLRTGDDKSAQLCLERLTDRFGPANERIMALRGLYQEATAEDTAALEKVLLEYEMTLEKNPVNTVRLEPGLGYHLSCGQEFVTDSDSQYSNEEWRSCDPCRGQPKLLQHLSSFWMPFPPMQRLGVNSLSFIRRKE